MNEKVTSPVMALLRVLLSAFLCVLMLVSPVSAQLAGVSVSAFELVSSKRLSRLEWESVYRVRVSNAGSALRSVVASATTVASHVTVVDGSVAVGDLAAGANRLAEDTITLRTNRSTAIDLATALSWTFSAAQPPADATPPAISGLLPAAAAEFAADALPEMAASFSDQGSGIDPASLEVELDGVPVTGQVIGSASGFTFTPTRMLTEGLHRLVVRVADRAGNRSTAQVEFTTRSAPTIAFVEPTALFLPAGAPVVVSATLSDIGSGIDPASVRLLIDGLDMSTAAEITASGLRYSGTPDETAHSVVITARDRAGNQAEASLAFTTAQAPLVSGLSPRDVILPAGSRPVVSAQYSDASSDIDSASVRLLVDGEDVTARASVSATGVSYTPASDFAEGPHTLYIEVANRAGSAASAAWSFEVQTATTHVVEVIEPAGGQTVPTIDLAVTARVGSNRVTPVSVTANGTPMAAVQGGSPDAAELITYSGSIKLVDGENTVDVVARFSDGTVRSERRNVFFDGPPRVTVVTPADKSILGRVSSSSPTDLTGNVERPVSVSGRVSKPATRVTINQQSAVLDGAGTTFTFDNYFLREGMNVLTVVATDASGRVGTSTVTVSVDQTAPILTIETPQDFHVTSAAAVDVRGVVNDAVEGMTGAPEPVVTVNGVQARVSDRYFLATTVPLQVGENVLSVEAVDHLGNRRVRELRVSRIAVGSHRLSALSGNGQTGELGTELPRPLAIVALDRDGQPVSDLPVSFDVMRNTGAITSVRGEVQRPDGVNPARSLVLRTDSAGRAQVWLTPGKQTGPGSNVVRAQVSAQAGSLASQFSGEIYFHATTQRGPVSKVLADIGTHQIAETGSTPLELLSVVVRDVSDNHLPDVPVVFTVEEGDAFFIDDSGTTSNRRVLLTDRNGVTALRPQIGLKAGLVRISARALRNADGDVNDPAQLTGNAQYQIQVREARDGATRFRGFIYTDKGEPLPGVRISAGRTSVVATTDDTGAFVLDNLPPGRIDLFVDGRTSSHLGQVWPSLHFEAFAVRGQENALPHPVYLPPLLSAQGKVVGGNEDVILTLPGIEGFQMKVKANSVTFPDGSRTGTLVVSPVTADKLPMAPPTGGAAFGLPAWTVQPAGTRFDPPIEVTLPNSRAYPPGDNLPVVQWDHDLGQFVPMGRATVSEDGALLVTDAGSGISKAGWGGLCVYDPDKCATASCKMCEKKNDSGSSPCCVFDDAKDQQTQYFQNFSLATEPFRAWLDKMTKVVSASKLVEAKVKFDGTIAGRAEFICCLRKKNTSAKLYGSGQFKAEYEVKVALLPMLERIQSFLPRGLDDATDAGLYFFLRGGGSFAGAVSYDACKSQPGPDSVTGSIFGNGALSARVKWPAIKAGGVEVFPDAEMNFGEVGITGGMKLLSLKLESESMASSPYESFLYAYFKGELRVGTLKFSSLDFQLPLLDSGGHLSVPVLGL